MEKFLGPETLVNIQNEYARLWGINILTALAVFIAGRIIIGLVMRLVSLSHFQKWVYMYINKFKQQVSNRLF
jgi:small conductance mechanosensitive channel